MEKSILILGQQGSGKTAKINEFLSNNKKTFKQMSYTVFKMSNKRELKEQFEVIIIYEIHYVWNLGYLIDFGFTDQFQFVLASQLDESQISESILSKFEVVNCSMVS